MSDTSPEKNSEDKFWEQFTARLKASLGLEPGDNIREDLEAALAEDQLAPKLFSLSERTMLKNILRFSELRIDDVMVPRADIVAVEDIISLSDLMQTFAGAGHSRLPVFHETLDDPRYFVHIKDLMGWLIGQAESGKDKALNLASADLAQSIGTLNIGRPMLYVPPSMKVSDLLLKMQSGRLHLAVVIDEYGGTDGLVSIEDLVEEVVGEIEDEHDAVDRPLITRQKDGTYVAGARAPIEELEKLTGTDLLPDEREEDADTLGGLVFSIAGRVPVRGELISHPAGLEFEVLDGDLRRIKRLRVHVKPSEPKRKKSHD